MSLDEREKIHHELLDALHTARKQVEYLEAALAHNAAFLGTGVERQSQLGKPPPGKTRIPDALVRYLDLVEPEDDISNYIGREGHDESRPRLGPDAPDAIRPKTEPSVNPLVGQLALGHPADSITFAGQSTAPFPGESPEELPGLKPLTPSPLPPSKSSEEARTPAAASATSTLPSQTRQADSPVSASGGSFEGDDALFVRHVALSVPDTAEAGEGLECLDLTRDNCIRCCLAIQASNEGVWDWDLTAGTGFFSSVWRKMVLPPEDARPRSEEPLDQFLAYMHPDDWPNIRRRFNQLLEGRSTRVRLAVRFARGNGWGWGMLRGVSRRMDGATVRITAILADITAWRDAELALRDSDERFRALVEDSPDLVCRFDKEGRFLYASPNAVRYATENALDLVGKDLADYDMSGEEMRFLKNVQQVFATAIPIQAEFLLTSPVAGTFVADCRFWPEFGVDGKVIAVSALIRDMTLSRRLAQNYYALFNRMGEGFVLFEHAVSWEGGVPAYRADEFDVVVVNPAFAKMFKLDQKAAVGMRLNEVVGNAASEWAACLRVVLENERSVENSLSDPLTRREYEISAYSPEAGRVACIVREITELKRIEEETRLNEARFSFLHRLSHMDAAPEDKVVRYCIEQAVKLTGSSFGYLYVASANDSEHGRLYWSHAMLAFEEKDAWHDRATVPPYCEGDACRDVHGAEVVNVVEGGFAEAFGDNVNVQRYMLAPVSEDGRIVCLAGVANKKESYSPGDLRQLELFISGMWFHLRRRWGVQTLKRAKEEAEAASRAKNEFLANVSHELRTPLNGILGMLQVLQHSGLNEEQRECVATANYSGRSLLRIISDILDFSRIEAGRIRLNKQLFDFSATVRSALGMFIHEATRKQIAFTLDLDDNIPDLLLGDDARVRQIIFNLVGNAFKFTSNGEVSVACRALPYCRKGMCCIYLAVRDTGIGIPDNRLGDVFRAFTQLDGSTTRRYAGTGLGLAIVQQLVQLMNSTLSVESVSGEGTTIHCSLVFELPGEQTKSVDSQPELPKEVHPLEILVVEDDSVSQFTLRRILEKLGHSSVSVENGREAIEILQLKRFDCIITDIQMPVMDGMELTLRIREENTSDIEPGHHVLSLLGLEPGHVPPARRIPRDIPIIALTAYAMRSDKERFLGMGMDYYLPKPLNGAKLALLLAHVGKLVSARADA